VRVQASHGSVAFDGHVVEVVGGAHQRLSRVPVASILDVVRQRDDDGNEVVLFFARTGSASTRFPAEQAAELDALVAEVNAARAGG
jgi:hypothetical protein